MVKFEVNIIILKIMLNTLRANLQELCSSIIIFMNITLQDNLIKTFINKKIWQIFKHAKFSHRKKVNIYCYYYENHEILSCCYFSRKQSQEMVSLKIKPFISSTAWIICGQLLI